MRLLSFLTDIERAIRVEANADEGAIWDSARIVNFKTGLARLTLVARDLDSGLPTGTLLVQYFKLANASFCLKANLRWQGSENDSSLSIFETPALNWKLEASRIATAWLAGPPVAALTMTEAEHEDRIAVAS